MFHVLLVFTRDIACVSVINKYLFVHLPIHFVERISFSSWKILFVFDCLVIY